MSAPVDLDRARAAKARLTERLDGHPALRGIGVTRSGEGYGVKVDLAQPRPEDLDLPESLDGVPVLVEVVGRISPQR